MPRPEDTAHLFQILAELAGKHEWFVLSGSIPRGVSDDIYKEMVRTLAGKKVMLDTSGEGFRQAVLAGPWLIKPNVDELSEYAGKPLETPAAILEHAHLVMGRYGIHSIVISMGKEGAIFVEGDESVWAVPPAVEVKSTVGAGDAMVAGIVAGKIRGLALAECARLATAFSVTAISHFGHKLPSIEAVQSAREWVTLRELSKV
jgi:1-phosphofructokinase family hexose kinase